MDAKNDDANWKQALQALASDPDAGFVCTQCHTTYSALVRGGTCVDCGGELLDRMGHRVPESESLMQAQPSNTTSPCPMLDDAPPPTSTTAEHRRDHAPLRNGAVIALLTAILVVLLLILLKPRSSPPIASAPPVTTTRAASASAPQATTASPLSQLLGRWVGFCVEFSSANFFPDGTVLVDTREHHPTAFSYSFPDAIHLKLSANTGASVLTFAVVNGVLRITPDFTPSHQCLLYRPGSEPTTQQYALIGAWAAQRANFTCGTLLVNNENASVGLRFWADNKADVVADGDYRYSFPYALDGTTLSLRTSSNSAVSSYQVNGDTLTITFTVPGGTRPLVCTMDRTI